MSQIKKGIEYFPLSHEIFENEDFVEVQNQYGPLGEAVYFRLLSLIFQNGYYYRFDSIDKLANKLIKSIGNLWAREKKTVIEIIECLIKNNLFSGKFMNDNVITSHEIQLRYLKATERRQSKVVEYCLLNDEERSGEKSSDVTLSGDNVTSEPDNATSEGDNVTSEPADVTSKVADVTSAATKRKESKGKVREAKGSEKKGNEKKGSEAKGSGEKPAPAVIDRDFLIEQFGEGNVVEYESRFQRWKTGKVTVNLPMYETIYKWLRQDGVTKPALGSSIDMDKTMEHILRRYAD